MTMSASHTQFNDEEKERAIQEGEGWALDYLDRVPFEDLHIALVSHALRQLRLALGPRYGHAAVSEVLRIIVGTGGDSQRGDVKERVDGGDISLLTDCQYNIDIDWQDITAEFAHLFAYARYGYARCFDPKDSATEIEALLEHFRLVAADPGVRAAAGENFAWIRDTLAAAEARWAIDHGRSVVPEDLAALAGVKPKTLANLLSAREFSLDAEGRIPAAEALRYLERRDDFVRSNWQYPVEKPAMLPDAPTLEDQVFVPVDGDGNPFLPSLARRGRNGVLQYTIGPKDDPKPVEDYWEALDRLARMPTPRWRRPPASGKGGWSLVSGQEGWRRFPRADLQRMTEATRKQEG